MPYAALVPRVNIFREVAVKNKTGFGLESSTYEKTLKSDHKKYLSMLSSEKYGLNLK